LKALLRLGEGGSNQRSHEKRGGGCCSKREVRQPCITVTASLPGPPVMPSRCDATALPTPERRVHLLWGGACCRGGVVVELIEHHHSNPLATPSLFTLNSSTVVATPLKA